MFMFLVLIGFFTVIVSIIMFIVSTIKKNGKKKKWAKALIGGIILFIFGISLDPSENTDNDYVAVSNEKEELNLEEFKSQCISIDYKELARNPSNYKGEKVKYTGEIIQVLENGLDVELRVNITKNEWGYEDTIYVIYTRNENEGRLLENDIVNIWGKSNELVTYETVMGSELSIPRVDAVAIELVN